MILGLKRSHFLAFCIKLIFQRFLSAILVCFCIHYITKMQHFLWTALCPAGWIVGPNKNRCFQYVESLRSWDMSEDFCKDNHGHLAALMSVQELSFAQKLCPDAVNGCWVGGRSFNSASDFGWKWSDNMSWWNKSVFPGEPSRFNCSSVSCHNINPIDSCTLVTNRHAALVGERCNTSHKFICMLDIGIIPFHLSYQIFI